MSTKPHARAGFTIVELLVVIAVLSILISLVMVTLGDFYQSNTTSLGQTVQATETRSALRVIETDLVNSAGFLTATSMTPTSPTGSANNGAAWSYTGNDSSNPNNRVLISSNYATDKVASDSTRSLVLCDPSSQPLTNNLVYFVAKDPNSSKYNLYRRTMVGTGTNCTATPAQRQTCASANLSLNPPCKAPDAVLLYDISNFTVDYYTTANQQTPITDEYGAGSGSIATAKSIKVTITTNRTINGTPTTYSSNIRITRLN